MLGLVGDIGGTNSRFALARAGQVQPASQRSYRNADFAGPGAVIAQYLRQMQDPAVGAICLGAAGPVQGGAVQLTNYPWQVSAAQLATQTGAGIVTLMNDLQAQGYALHGLGADAVMPLVPGAAAGADAARLIVAIGTGVNAAIATQFDGRVGVPPSESGHMALPLQDETDLAIAAMIRDELGHCPVEAALSGAGLVRLWRFFGGPEARDGAAVMQAVTEGDPAAEAALARFVRYLARYCADLALIHLPMGGIYLAGSVGLAVAPHLARLGFADLFHRPGPYAEIHRAIPVFAVPHVQLTLAGCARRLWQDLD